MQILNKITMDNKLLKDLKEDLEKKIDHAFKTAIKEQKKTKVNLRMTIEMNKNAAGDSIPKIEYETGFSVKENSFKSKKTIGENYTSAMDNEGNLIIEEDNQQLEIEEK